MILYHGTTQSRAARIRHVGFKVPDFVSETETLCTKHGLTVADVFAKLDELQRFVSFRHGDTSIYLTSHFHHASSYSTRAPEFIWESLVAIYNVFHPELGLNWNQSNELHAWVLSQIQDDPPVVLHVEINDEILGSEADRIRRFVEIVGPDFTGGGEEVSVPWNTPITVVDRTPSDHLIDGSLLRFLAGVTAAEIEAQVNAGEWGTPVENQLHLNWRWQDVKARLPSGRLAALNLL